MQYIVQLQHSKTQQNTAKRSKMQQNTARLKSDGIFDDSFKIFPMLS